MTYLFIALFVVAIIVFWGIPVALLYGIYHMLRENIVQDDDRIDSKSYEHINETCYCRNCEGSDQQDD